MTPEAWAGLLALGLFALCFGLACGVVVLGWLITWVFGRIGR